MKKLIILLLLFSLTLGLLASCTPNDTSSVGEISKDISNEISTDMSDEVSTEESNTVVEVTDEAVIAEIKALLEKYNEYVLIVNMCEGSLKYEGEAIDYTISYEHWFNIDITKENYDALPSPPILDFNGYKIVDERFSDIDSFQKLLEGIYISELAEMYYRSEFAFCWEDKDSPFDHKYDSFSRYPRFNFFDGYNYSTLKFTDNATLRKRYIDIDSIAVFEGSKGYVVTARGSSLFKDGKVQDADSDVKFLITDENGALKISEFEAKRDHITDEKTSSAQEKLENFFKEFGSITSLIRESDEVTLNTDSDPSYLYYFYIRDDNIEAYLTEDDIFKSIVDVYDWVNSFYYTTSAENYFTRSVFGTFDPAGCVFPTFIYSTAFPDKLYLNKAALNSGSPLGQAHNIDEDFIDGFEFKKTESGYLAYYFDGEYYLLFYLDEIDLFGDGDYSLRIKNSRETKEKYLTDEEKALLGIE